MDKNSAHSTRFHRKSFFLPSFYSVESYKFAGTNRMQLYDIATYRIRHVNGFSVSRSTRICLFFFYVAKCYLFALN